MHCHGLFNSYTQYACNKLRDIKFTYYYRFRLSHTLHIIYYNKMYCDVIKPKLLLLL